MSSGVCTLCGQDWSGRRHLGLCRACYVYQWRTGRERPRYLRETHYTPDCQDCGQPSYYMKQQLCRRCYMFRKRRQKKLDLIMGIKNVAIDTESRATPASDRLMADWREKAVSHEIDIILGRINAN